MPNSRSKGGRRRSQRDDRHRSRQERGRRHLAPNRRLSWWRSWCSTATRATCRWTAGRRPDQSYPSPSKSAAAGTSVAAPSARSVDMLKPDEDVRDLQVPLDGRNSARSLLLSPSRSLGVGHGNDRKGTSEPFVEPRDCWPPRAHMIGVPQAKPGHSRGSIAVLVFPDPRSDAGSRCRNWWSRRTEMSNRGESVWVGGPIECRGRTSAAARHLRDDVGDWTRDRRAGNEAEHRAQVERAAIK